MIGGELLWRFNGRQFVCLLVSNTCYITLKKCVAILENFRGNVALGHLCCTDTPPFEHYDNIVNSSIKKNLMRRTTVIKKEVDILIL